jgi:hypothetical protein
MKLLDKLKTTTGHAPVGAPSPPAWHTSLASLGWSTRTLTTIATIRSSRGPGFLGSTYPNVLVVLKAGPAHPGARRVVAILDQIVSTTGGELEPSQPSRITGGASPTGQAGTQEGAGAATNDTPGTTTNHRSQWKTLADYEDAQQLRAKLNALLYDPRFHVAHYSQAFVNVFNASWKSGNIAKVREAYYGVLEKWVRLRRLGYG